MRRVTPLAALALLVLGCVDKDAPLEPPVGGGGKADIADRVPVIGPLALGGEVRGGFNEDLQFFGYRIEVGPAALVDLEITQKGTVRRLDTALFVYGPERAGGGFGSEALGADDDSGWGKNARLDALALPGAGRYLVVVGTHDGRGRGGYRLTAGCASASCAPLDTSTCHPVIAADIRACAAALLAESDGESMTERDAIELCSDAEPAADAFDALCASPSPPGFCGSFEGFATEVLPRCAHELVGELLDRSCAFGAFFRDVREERAPGQRVLAHRMLTSAAGLDALERSQIVLALHASSHDEVTTAEQAFEAADQGEIFAYQIWDATNRRAFTAIEYGAGDNSFGMIFERGTTTVATRINDSDLMDCQVMHGPELRDCAADLDCAAGLRCVGRPADGPRGRCVDLARDDSPAEGTTCGAAAPCSIDDGLACAGLTRGDQGLCLPAWQTRRVTSAPALAIPDGGTAGARAQVLVYGLTTVDMDVALDTVIVHPRTSQLRVLLANPAGTEVVVYDGAGKPDVGVLELGGPVLGFSGDEPVNGAWTVRVVDRTAGQAGGVLDHFALTVSSRWD